MNACNDHDVGVAFEGRACPLCEVEAELTQAEKRKCDLERELDEVEAEIQALRSDLDELGPMAEVALGFVNGGETDGCLRV